MSMRPEKLYNCTILILFLYPGLKSIFESKDTKLNMQHNYCKVPDCWMSFT